MIATIEITALCIEQVKRKKTHQDPNILIGVSQVATNFGSLNERDLLRY